MTYSWQHGVLMITVEIVFQHVEEPNVSGCSDPIPSLRHSTLKDLVMP
jgi:predicted enzyme related to lactoylglutathione lyase